jgi:calcineurin-like phosphoesterase family protein
VYHLGDLSFHKPPRTIEILRQLNGIIRLIQGNHDRKQTTAGPVVGFLEWIKNYYESKTEDGVKIVMSHYPFMTWNKAHHGALHVHGHSHGNLHDSGTTRVDVGVDTTPDYAPLSYYELMQRFEGRTYDAVDHHAPRVRRGAV